METGDLSEWAGMVNSGSAESVAVTAFSAGIPPKTGSWVLRQAVTGSVGGTRITDNGGINVLGAAGTPFYVSWWDYYPTKITFGVSDFFMILQIASRDSNGVYNPIWGFYLNPSDSTPVLGYSPSDAAPYPGPHAGESGKRAYFSTQPVPVGQWVFFEIMVKPAADFTGAVKIWMNRQVIFDQQLVKTKFPEGPVSGLQYVQHTAYGSNLTPIPAVHYLDDITVSLGRMP
jgi:hypothetical protein